MKDTNQKLVEWRIGKRPTQIVSDVPTCESGHGHDEIEYYGGYLVAESVPSEIAELIVGEHNCAVAIRRQCMYLNANI